MLKKLKILIAAVLANIAFGVPAHAAVILQVNNDGVLTGATGVTVLGEIYDVTFTEGTCKALFNGCDSPGDFVFGTGTTARAAALALLSQVFVGGYDDYPSLTLGTPRGDISVISTPYSAQGPAYFLSWDAHNASLSLLNMDRVAESSTYSGYDYSRSAISTFSIWAPASTVPETSSVPEPATSALLGVAALALLWSRRRRQPARASGAAVT